MILKYEYYLSKNPLSYLILSELSLKSQGPFHDISVLLTYFVIQDTVVLSFSMRLMLISLQVWSKSFHRYRFDSHSTDKILQTGRHRYYRHTVFYLQYLIKLCVCRGMEWGGSINTWNLALNHQSCFFLICFSLNFHFFRHICQEFKHFK